jgi:hypothetical protein
MHADKFTIIIPIVMAVKTNFDFGLMYLVHYFSKSNLNKMIHYSLHYFNFDYCC